MKTLASIVAFLLVGGQLPAQPLSGNRYVKAELISDARDLSGPFSVGIRFLIEPDWYLYWKNPGDAGLPVQVTWTLPEGWTAGPLEHPTPKKMVYDEIIAYGYKREVILFTTISPGPDRGRPQIAATLDWLVCKESCVRGKADVALDIGALSESDRDKARVLAEPFRSLLPESATADVFLRDPVVHNGNGELVLTIALAGTRAGEVTDFFPEVSDELQVRFSTVKVEDRQISMIIAPAPGLRKAEVKGLLITGTRAYESGIVIELPST